LHEAGGGAKLLKKQGETAQNPRRGEPGQGFLPGQGLILRQVARQLALPKGSFHQPGPAVTTLGGLEGQSS